MVFVLTLITACGNSSTATEPAEKSSNSTKSSEYSDEKYVLKLSHGFSSTHFMHTFMEWFNDEVEKRSDGRLSIQIYPNAQLVPHDQEAPALVQGQIDMVHGSSSVLNSFDPIWNFYALPFLFKYDKDDPSVYFDQKQKFNDHKEGGQKIARMMEEKGIKVLAIGSIDIFGSILTKNKEVTDLASFNGLRVRSPGGINPPATIEALGASSVTISGTEAITALQQGVVDATMTVPMYAYDAKLPIDTYHVAPLFDSANPVLISLKTFNSLPKDLQDILVEVGKDYENYHREVLTEKLKETLPKMESEMGVEIYYPTEEEIAEMKKATKPVWDAFVKQVEGGKEMLEVLESIQ
jgi:TRAP-type C4-dicarboxylate transport system substrate-binding protein